MVTTKERVDCKKFVMTSTNLVTASSVFETMLIADTYKIDENKIKKITPGVDRKIFIPDLSVEKENIILSIGRIQEQKGQLQTIEFLNNLKKFKMILNVILLVVQVESMAMNICTSLNNL